MFMVRVRSGGKVSDGDFGRACVLGQAMSFILVSSTCLLSVSLGLTAGRYKVTTAVRAPACFTYKTLSVRCTTQFEMCRPVHCSCTGSTENCTRRKMPKQTSLCSASDLSWQHDTARICCSAPALQESTDISWPPDPQQQTRRRGLRRPNDATHARQFKDPAPHTMRAVSKMKKTDCRRWETTDAQNWHIDRWHNKMQKDRVTLHILLAATQLHKVAY